MPAAWSQVAADVIAQKYFRKAGVPSKIEKIMELDVPEGPAYFGQEHRLPAEMSYQELGTYISELEKDGPCRGFWGASRAYFRAREGSAGSPRRSRPLGSTARSRLA